MADKPFWQSKAEPLLKSRFKVDFGGTLHWWAKSVTQPTMEVSQNEYQIINHKIKIPGIVTWTDIDIVFIELGGKGKALYDKLLSFGYHPAPAVDGNDGMMKHNLNIKIEKFPNGDSDGTGKETWTLIDAMIKSINFSDLDYSSDDLVEVSLTVSYDRAKLS